MGNQCCTKCILSHTCCLCWCGCANCITGEYSKSSTLKGENSLIPLKSIKNSNDLEKDLKKWKTGDIILMHKDRSPATVIISNSPWTHVGIIYNRNDNPKIKLLDDKNNNEINILFINARAGYKNPITKEDTAIETINCENLIYGMQMDGIYIGYRELKTEYKLSNENIELLQKSILNLRKKSKYGGFGLNNITDIEAYRAAIDCGCSAHARTAQAGYD